jgi:hypothetical protein
MSNEKKHKGRDPEAIEQDQTKTRLVQKFLGMPEIDYIRSVVIPVLEGEGYEKIDYHHGNTEIGKDLIFFKREPFGRRSLAVAVIKVDRLSKSSSDPSGFPVILVQAQQAMSNEVLSWDGTKRRPDEVLLILADDPSHDIITSNQGTFLNCVQAGLRVVCGTDIANSLLEHRREIAEQILQSKLDASKFLQANPTNLPLLHALHSNEAIDIKTIFMDLDAAVGATTMTHAVSLRSSSSNKVKIHESDWPIVSSLIHDFEETFGPVLLDPLAVVEAKYAKINRTANSAANLNLWKSINDYAIDIERWSTSLRQDADARATVLNDEQAKYSNFGGAEYQFIGQAHDLAVQIREVATKISLSAKKIQQRSNVMGCVSELHAEIDRYQDVINAAAASIKKIKVGLQLDIKANKNHRAVVEIAVLIDLEQKNARSYLADCNKSLERAQRFVPVTDYEIVFDTKSLDEKLRAHVDALVCRFHSSKVANSRDYAKRLLEDTRRYLSSLESFTSNSVLSCVLKPDVEVAKNNVRLGACILGLLGSGVDVLVTGNAGSGKSTTLEMFARQRYESRETTDEVIFLPLAKVAPLKPDEAAIHPLFHFFDEVARLFKTSQPGVTSKYVRERVEAAKRLVLVLDGIDEAAGLLTWLVGSIKFLRALKKDNLQVVASSRFHVPQLEGMGFFNIELLPFRPEQVRRFIGDFLKDDQALANEVVEHLDRHPNMLSVSQTPLMSTILCVLAKNGVVLPETKNALYKERFELLWGAYDAKKQVRRVKSSKACLEDVSKKASYFLHMRRMRSAPRAEILEYVSEALRWKYRPQVIGTAFEELERPCDVLMEDVEGTVGFGHLSYQEYLVSDELYTSRQGEIVKYLSDPWWRGVLVFAAMKTEDIGSIIEERVTQEGMVGNAAGTLRAMIEVCQPGQKKILKELLRNQVRLDSMYESTSSDSEFDEY